MKLDRKQVLLTGVALATVTAFSLPLTMKTFLVSANSTAASSDAQEERGTTTSSIDRAIGKNAEMLVQRGMKIFRFDTFGSQDFFGSKLHLHEAIEGSKLAGVGPGVSPKIQ